VRRRSCEFPAGERDTHEHDVPALRVGEHLAVGQVDPSIHRSTGHSRERARRKDGQPLVAVAARRQGRHDNFSSRPIAPPPRRCPAETSGLLRKEL
jgi:hypothetical protein